jgi:hypothetical protein
LGREVPHFINAKDDYQQT